MNYCPNCSTKVEGNSNYCIECGVEFDPNLIKKNMNDDSIINSQINSSNQGLIGFVLAIISLILPIPIIDTIIGFIGLIFSVNGLKEAKNGLAITGLVISIIAIVGSIVLFLTDGYDFF